MANGVNKVILIGNLGADPEVKYMPNGEAVVNMTVATGESWKDKNTGEKVEKTEWHRIVAFRRLAEIISEYLQKGSKVYVEGKLQTRKWQDKEGKDNWTTEIIANEMRMLDSRPSEQSQNRSNHGTASQQSAPSQADPEPAAGSPNNDFADDTTFLYHEYGSVI